MTITFLCVYVQQGRKRERGKNKQIRFSPFRKVTKMYSCLLSWMLDRQLFSTNLTYFPNTRPTLPQLWSLEIRRRTFLSFIKLADRLILRLLNFERAGREWSRGFPRIFLQVPETIWKMDGCVVVVLVFSLFPRKITFLLKIIIVINRDFSPPPSFSFHFFFFLLSFLSLQDVYSSSSSSKGRKW